MDARLCKTCTYCDTNRRDAEDKVRCKRHSTFVDGDSFCESHSFGFEVCVPARGTGKLKELRGVYKIDG